MVGFGVCWVCLVMGFSEDDDDEEEFVRIETATSDDKNKGWRWWRLED